MKCKHIFVKHNKVQSFWLDVNISWKSKQISISRLNFNPALCFLLLGERSKLQFLLMPAVDLIVLKRWLFIHIFLGSFPVEFHLKFQVLFSCTSPNTRLNYPMYCIRSKNVQTTEEPLEVAI